MYRQRHLPSPQLTAATHTYVQEYVALLSSVQSANEIHERVADWLLSNQHRVAGVVTDLNESLGLQGKKKFRNHIPTVAVGALTGTLFVSANPGYNEHANRDEHRLRTASPASNRSFCSDFFEVYRGEIGGSAWWTRAIRLAHWLETSAAPPQHALSCWNWAHTQSRLIHQGPGNVDLIPFHSTADGFSAMNVGGEAAAALEQIAVATLRMVINLKDGPRLIFVASAGGRKLLERKGTALQLEVGPLISNAYPYSDYLSQYIHLESGRRVVTYGWQLFSGNFARQRAKHGLEWEILAALVRPLARPAET